MRPTARSIPAFVEGANIADANGWTISGEWSTSDGKWQTLVAMLQAGGGQPINRGAQISVLVNAPRVSTYTYTKSDLVGQAQIKPLTPRRDRKNTIIPRYRSQPNGWEYVAAGEVTASTYRTEDRGEQRSTEVEYVHVRDARQAGQLAAYDLVNLREGLTATLPSKVHLMSVHAGDCITVDVPELALANQKFVVMRTPVDYKSAGVTLELRSETDAKHAFALGQTDQAPPSPALSAVDPRYIAPPVADDWSVVPQPPSGGTTQPIVIVIGKTEVGDAASIIVETGPSTTGPWSTVYAGTPLLDGRYPSPGLQPRQQYWVSVRYVAKNGAISDRLIQGPITASQLVAGDVSPNAPGLSPIKEAIAAANEGLEQIGDAVDGLNQTVYDAQTGLQARTEQLWDDINDATDGLKVRTGALFDRLDAPGTGVEARITDLAQSVEDGDEASAERFQALEAFSAAGPNHCPNGGLGEGLAGLSSSWPLVWVVSDTWGPNVAVVPSGDGTYVIEWPAFDAAEGVPYTVSGDTLLFASGGASYFDLQFRNANGQVVHDGGQSARGPAISATALRAARPWRRPRFVRLGPAPSRPKRDASSRTWSIPRRWRRGASRSTSATGPRAGRTRRPSGRAQRV